MTCLCCDPTPDPTGRMSLEERRFMAGAGFMRSMETLGRRLVLTLCPAHRMMLEKVLAGVDQGRAEHEKGLS